MMLLCRRVPVFRRSETCWNRPPRPCDSLQRYPLKSHSEPLSSYDPSFWGCCFPVLFPWGLGIHGSLLRTDIPFQDGVRLLLLRVDRPEPLLCRCDLPFIATLFSTRHKRALLQAARVKIEMPAWQATVARLAQLKSTDFLQVFHVLQDTCGLPEALRSKSVSDEMKGLLRGMCLVQSTVPCTDGARWAMRQQITSLHDWLGCPVLFLTLNPADIARPLTLRYSFSGSSLNDIPLDFADADLQHILTEHNLASLVATDPVSAVQSFYHHVQAMCEDLFCCTASGASLSVDGVASHINPTIHLIAVPYGQNASMACADFGDSPLAVWVLDMRATHTRVYDFNNLFKSFLQSTAKGDARPRDVDDLSAFGMRLVCAPAPAYHRLLYCDAGKDGLQQGYALLVKFLQYVCAKSVHAKRLTSLRVCVRDDAGHAGDFLQDFADGSKLKLIRGGPDLIAPHPASLRGPGVATLVLQYLCDTDEAAESALPLAWFDAQCATRTAQPDASALSGNLVPQYTGSWFGLRRILEAHGFEAVESTGAKWFEASPLSPDSDPREWFQALLADMERLPLQVRLPDGFIAWDAVLDKPYILVEN